MTTTVGETASDFLNFNIHFGLSRISILMGPRLFLTLLIQSRANQYVPWIYSDFISFCVRYSGR